MKWSISEKKQKGCVAAFFAVLIIIGLWMGIGYGVPCDEKSEQRILARNLYEYAYRILGEENALVQVAQKSGVILISESIERDHGIASLYPLAPIFLIEDSHLVMVVWHAYIWLLFMLGVLAIYMLARELGFSRIIACITSLLLYLSPRFFAEGHYNNKDIVLLSFALCIFALAARLMRERRFIFVFLFSVAGAFAANIKMIGTFAWGLGGLAVLWKWLSEKKFSRRDFRIIISGVALFAAAYFLITPAMWKDPIGFFKYLYDNTIHFSRWDSVVLFGGELFKPAQGEPLPWYYLPQMILITLPIPYLCLSLAGQIYAFVLCAKGDRHRPLLLALSIFWIAPILLAMLLKPLIYNGWRHFYFTYAGIAIMGGMGLNWLYTLVRKKPVQKIAYILVVATMFVAQASSILMNHPYQYVYYNAFAGEVDGKYELDYWMLSLYHALEELADCTTRRQDLPLIFSTAPNFPSIDHFLLRNYEALPQEKKDVLQYTSDYENAPYLVYDTTTAIKAGLSRPDGYKELFSISGYHHALVIVYEKDE